MSDLPMIRIGDGSSNENYRTCAVCGRDCEPEIFEGGEGVGIRVAFSCPDLTRAT